MGKYKVKVYNCYSLHVRTQANASSKVVDWLQRDNVRTSSKQASNGWMYIDEEKGWSNGKYLKKIQDLTPKPPAPAKPKPKPKPKPKVEPIKVNESLYAVSEGTDFKAFTPDGRVSTRLDNKVQRHPKVNLTSTEDTQGMTLQSMNTNTLSETTGARMSTGDYGGAKYSLQSTSTSQGTSDNPVPDPVVPDMTWGVGDYVTDYSELENYLTILRRNLNIEVPGDGDVTKALYNHFNRFKIEYPGHILAKTFHYVFFTRPELYIYTKDGKKLRTRAEYDPFLYQMSKTHPRALKSLTKHFSKKHKFHPFLSNAAKSFEIPDETLKNLEHGETLVGNKINYGKSNIEAHVAGTFSVQYEEDVEYNIYMIHKIWVEYISKVYRGDLDVDSNLLFQKILDYAASVYYFVCGPDGETILFWSKYYGVFPLSVPTSASSWTKGSTPRPLDLSINYGYSMKEDVMPATLFEFNDMSNEDFKYYPMYNEKEYRMNRSISGSPYIESVNIGGHAGHKLRFRKL